MLNRAFFGPSAAAISLILGSNLAVAQPTIVTFDEPTLDRWVYPFNTEPGFRAAASTFGALGVAIFDDREAQFLIGFDTGVGAPPPVEPTLPLPRYQITSAIVTATIAVGGVFEYDPSQDPFQTFLDPADPDFQPDADTGRPITLFGAGYRNSASLASFQEDSPYSTSPTPGPAPELRDVFATDFLNAVPRDVSNNVRDAFEVTPFAVGQTLDAAPGASVPNDAVFTFDLDLGNPDVVRYLKEGLQAGRINLILTSLHPASGGPDGGSGVAYPVFFTKEDKFSELFMLAPTLTIEVEVLPEQPADFTGDGLVTASDLSFLLGQWGSPGPEADLDGNGLVGAPDLAQLLGAWSTDTH